MGNMLPKDLYVNADLTKFRKRTIYGRHME